ncbi:MAG: pyridoxamine 5'-phosphate oxidase family protein [Defluviitaleaceae bacterium]|nr:pyridoxamine 5'-phosphate oxidase family protein [Defluviitaleaceae bacterium]
MRRADREVFGQDIFDILDKCEVMRIGLCAGGKPYIVPMNFAYEITEKPAGAETGLVFYFHCATAGKKLDMIAQNDSVCFEADCSFGIIKAGQACDWGAEFESVMGEGVIGIVAGEAQKIAALDLIMKRYGFEGKLEYSPETLAKTAVLRLRVAGISGKRKKMR